MPAPVKLNSASAGDLDAIPELQGHGFEIVHCREERGKFESFRQLNEVPGLAGNIPDEGFTGLVTD